MWVGIHGIAECCPDFGILEAFDDSIGMFGRVDYVAMVYQLAMSLACANMQ